MPKFRTLFAVLVAVILGIIATSSPAIAYAANGNSPYCHEDVEHIDHTFGAKTPVILVHGMDGSPSQWTKRGGSDVNRSINALPKARVALNFSYSNTAGYLGHSKRLARSIECVSQISSRNGGDGKVIVVGYSLVLL